MALELDVTQHDHLVVAGHFLEGALQEFARVVVVAAVPVAIRLDHALGRIQQAFAGRVFAGPGQQRAYGIFGLGAGDLGVGWRLLGLVHQ